MQHQIHILANFETQKQKHKNKNKNRTPTKTTKTTKTPTKQIHNREKLQKIETFIFILY
jgi:hypothetical protein